MASLQAQVSSLQGQIAGEQQRFASQAAELAQLRQVTLDAKTMVPAVQYTHQQRVFITCSSCVAQVDTQVRISENLDAELARVKEQVRHLMLSIEFYDALQTLTIVGKAPNR